MKAADIRANWQTLKLAKNKQTKGSRRSCSVTVRTEAITLVQAASVSCVCSISRRQQLRTLIVLFAVRPAVRGVALCLGMWESETLLGNSAWVCLGYCLRYCVTAWVTVRVTLCYCLCYLMPLLLSGWLSMLLYLCYTISVVFSW